MSEVGMGEELVTDSARPQPPAGWRVAERPLRIAMLGWARLAMQAREGSGYNLNASDLAAGLVLSGHEVKYLRSGMGYTLRRGPFIKKTEVWRGIECHELFNSPNLSPASSNFRNMAMEMSCPAQSALVVRWLDEIGAQVVHIHSLEGYSLDLVAAIRGSGRPVVVTPHNYWYGCPQVDLLHEELRVCTDYRGGERCVGCLDAPRPARARLRRSLDQSAYRILGPYFTHLLRGMASHARRTARRIAKGKKPTARVPRQQGVDPELALGYDIPDIRDHGGEVFHGWRLEPGETTPQIGPAERDTNEKFLRADHHLVVLNDYGRRRAAGIAALNAASMVTPPSRFVLEAMHAMGLRRELGRHVRLGQPHFDQLNRVAQRSPFYEARPWDARDATRPVRFGFFGTTRNNKGLEVLARAIPMLARDVRQRCHFLVRALGYDWQFRRRLCAYPEVNFVGGYDMLQLVASGGEFDVGILPHIWFENSPLVLLEFLHAGKFVISSRLGGPPEWITEPGKDERFPLGNGLLFTGGRAEELAAAITRVVMGEVVLPSAKEVHAVSPLRSYPDHIAEVEGIYREVLGEKPSAAVEVRTDARGPAVAVR
ncbi:MAG: glycosyltransferase [Phycisphaerales bacterium]|nr:glycosyltransferase [Phycisphaerales bacterium]